MDVELARTFLEVATSGSFLNAAKRLHVTQSTVSLRIKRPGAVEADYNWALETALGKYGIEIPFPQRDLHIRSGTLPINLTAESHGRVPKSA